MLKNAIRCITAFKYGICTKFGCSPLAVFLCTYTISRIHAVTCNVQFWTLAVQEMTRLIFFGRLLHLMMTMQIAEGWWHWEDRQTEVGCFSLAECLIRWWLESGGQREAARGQRGVMRRRRTNNQICQNIKIRQHGCSVMGWQIRSSPDESGQQRGEMRRGMANNGDGGADK